MAATYKKYEPSLSQPAALIAVDVSLPLKSVCIDYEVDLFEFFDTLLF